MEELPTWLKKAYQFEKVNNYNEMWYNDSRILGFLYKDSHLCNELRRGFGYKAYTFQHILDVSTFNGEHILINNEFVFYYTYLSKFIWLFNPKHAIIEVNLNQKTPLIISAPDIPFEMVLAPIITEEEFNEAIDVLS